MGMMTKEEIKELRKISREAPAQSWMTGKELRLLLKENHPEKLSKYSPTIWLRTTGKNVTRLLPEPLPPKLKKFQKYKRMQVMEYVKNPPEQQQMRDWLRRTAEADASGKWVPLAGVQDRLLVCNERFKEEQAVSCFLAANRVGKSIRRLFDRKTERVPWPSLSLQRYYLPDVLRVAESYRTRIQTSRFIMVEEAPEHTWLSFTLISKLTGCPRQRLIDLAVNGHIEAVVVRSEIDTKLGAKTRAVCYADFAAVREVLCWRSRNYAVRIMGEKWMKDRIVWQGKYGLTPPFVSAEDVLKQGQFEVYAPELVNEKASYKTCTSKY